MTSVTSITRSVSGVLRATPLRRGENRPSGKSLAARAIHYLGRKPSVDVPIIGGTNTDQSALAA
ncbi:MAG TPA: hypothetical protein VHK24_10565 [Steroidobacter sp.]|nr:hypothetical protein [Steroidobacter sp.]